MGRHKKDPVRNWWSKVQAGDDCWPWIAGHDRDGYGKFAIGQGGHEQIHTRAHRFAYETFIGPIPEGTVVCHSCDNPPCCNPKHLFIATPLGNNADKVAKNRHANLWGRPLTHSRQTECTNGHPFDEENTYIDRNGYRSCRICRREASKRAYYRARE